MLDIAVTIFVAAFAAIALLGHALVLMAVLGGPQGSPDAGRADPAAEKQTRLRFRLTSG